LLLIFSFGFGVTFPSKPYYYATTVGTVESIHIIPESLGRQAEEKRAACSVIIILSPPDCGSTYGYGTVPR
jgi:hypothetical protein